VAESVQLISKLLGFSSHKKLLFRLGTSFVNTGSVKCNEFVEDLRAMVH
jgi:hypothetical protein